MASIEDQLGREEWDPQPGDQLTGPIVAFKPGLTKKGQAYPILVIKNDADGVEYIAGQSGAVASDIIAVGPRVGDRVGIRFIGPQQNRNGDTFEKYVIAFDGEDDPEPDWETLRRDRNIAARTRRAPADPADRPASTTASTEEDGELPF